MGNNSFIKDNKERILLLVLVIAPFVYLLPYVLPFGLSGFDVSVGNDFRILYYNYKVYLLHFLSRLEIPYWSPSEASGYPFVFSPFTQSFYPLNILLAVFYKLAGGYSSVDHVRFTVLAFSILSAGFYKWLRALNINILPAFISALLITSSVGTLEIIRFPNAIHTLCWFPWILFAVSSVFTSERKSSYFKYSLLLLFFLVCSVTAGYPYYLYYSVFVFVPYFLFFLFKFTRTHVLKLERDNVIVPVIIVVFTVAFAFLLCYPYLHSVSELMNQTNGRGGNNYEYSTTTSESPLSTLGSLIYPPLSSINTSFYLGLLNLFVILVYFINSNRGAGDRKKWILLIWISLLVYVTYSSGSLLFNFFWHYFPFFSSLREWGRLNKVLLILFAWLLGLAYHDLFKRIKENKLYFGRTEIILFGVSAVIIVLNVFFSTYKIVSVEWQEYFVNSKVDMLLLFRPKYAAMLKSLLTSYGYIFLVSSVLIFLALLKLRQYNKYQVLSSKLNTVIVFILVFTFLESYTFAPWLWIKAEKSKIREQLTLDNKTAFETQRTFLYKTVSLNNVYNSGVVADWYYTGYTEFLKKHSADTVSLNKLLGLNTGRKLFFSKEINYNDIKPFLADASSPEIKVVDYTGNLLEINVSSNTDGYISFIDNWDEKWKVTVNGIPENIYKLFNTFKSVHINKGNNNIRFYYKPF
ncbi:MAG: hypothetical protein WCK13_00335 [Ignavibacteriota bacterium]